MPYTVLRDYTPDLTLTFKDGTIRYIECKGYFDTEDRSKHLLIKQQHPDMDIRFIFMANNKIHKLSTTRYSDWCDKHGFKYAFRQVPEEWLEP